MARGWIAGAAAGLALAVLGCGPPEAKAPNPTRPIDEGRAVKLIAQALQAQGLEPLPPRMVTLAGGTQVRLDVGVQGREIGFVYLTAADVRALGDDPIATRPNVGSELIVRTGEGEDEKLHAVILYATDYLYDDNVGEEHEATAITAENKLDRDARDFMMIARKNHWP
ncbi:MAG: hypothetical protein ACOC1F_14780 [Myxococcota bacterium]